MRKFLRATLAIVSLLWLAVLIACSGTTSSTPQASKPTSPPESGSQPGSDSPETAESDATDSPPDHAAGANDQAPTQPTADPKKPRLYGLDETVHVGYTTYMVYKASWTKQLGDNQLLRQEADAEFLVLELSVRNDDKKPRTIPPFHLIDEYDAEYDVAPAAWVVKGNIGPLDSLNPDVTKQGLIAFDVPRGRRYRLKISGGFWSTEDAFIAITEESDSQRAAKEAKAQEAEERRVEAAARKEAIETAKWRTWTSKKGNHKTEAKFVKSAKGIVTLEKKDGKSVELSIDKLCDDDQEFISKSKWRLATPK